LGYPGQGIADALLHRPDIIVTFENISTCNLTCRIASKRSAKVRMTGVKFTIDNSHRNALPLKPTNTARW
ncbi:MAG: hypothetical protein VXW25_07835, partial [Pseudomonadota bacterium]|nr:hypothetical protein [Pseudomonadota bacterium]